MFKKINKLSVWADFSALLNESFKQYNNPLLNQVSKLDPLSREDLVKFIKKSYTEENQISVWKT